MKLTGTKKLSYGKNFSPRKLRMRERDTKTTVPLDVVPERRTERFPPRFRPVGRFCEQRFRYQSSPKGGEGEISRPLDHWWQIPNIHSTRFMFSSNIYTYKAAFWSFPPFGTLNCVLMRHIWQLRMRSFRKTHFKVQRYVMFHAVRAGAYWHKIDGIYACVFAEQTKHFIISYRPIGFYHHLSFYLLFPIPSLKLRLYECADCGRPNAKKLEQSERGAPLFCSSRTYWKAVWEGKANTVQIPVKQSIKTHTKNFLTEWS